MHISTEKGGNDAKEMPDFVKPVLAKLSTLPPDDAQQHTRSGRAPTITQTNQSAPFLTVGDAEVGRWRETQAREIDYHARSILHDTRSAA